MPLRFKYSPHYSLFCVVEQNSRWITLLYISAFFTCSRGRDKSLWIHLYNAVPKIVSACLLPSGLQTSSIFRMPVSAYHRASYRGRECETAVRNQLSNCQRYNALWTIMSIYSCPRNVKKITIASLIWHNAVHQQDSLSVRKWNVTDIRTKKQSSAHFVTHYS